MYAFTSLFIMNTLYSLFNYIIIFLHENREAKDKQIQQLKDALRDAHESLTTWKDACQEYGLYYLISLPNSPPL